MHHAELGEEKPHSAWKVPEFGPQPQATRRETTRQPRDWPCGSRPSRQNDRHSVNACLVPGTCVPQAWAPSSKCPWTKPGETRVGGPGEEKTSMVLRVLDGGEA